MPFQFREVVSNVEASLGFIVSLKLVETIVAVLRTEGSSLEWKSRAGFLFLGRPDQQEPPAHVLWSSLPLVACIVTLLLVVLSAPVASGKASPSTTLNEFLGTASHIATLAVARVGLTILVVPSNGDGTTAFSTGRSLVQIMFGAVAVSCITALKTKEKSSSSSSSALSMLFSNVQRAFAQQIAALVPDESSRRTVAAFGLCLFPTFAGVLLPSSSSSAQEGQEPPTMQGVLLGIPSRSSSSVASTTSSSSLDAVHRTFSASLVRMWVSGLCTTWLNIAIDLLLAAIDDEGGGGPELSRAAMLVVTGLSICIVWKALHGLVRGVQLFQGYVEWNVASALLGIVQQTMSPSASSPAAEASARLHLLVVSTSCIAFFFFDAVRRDLLVLVSKEHKFRRAVTNGMMLEQAVEVLHSVSSIMFTNSLVSWAMELFSDPTDPDDGGIGDALAMLVVGIVVARILLKVMSLRSSSDTDEDED